MLGGHVRLGLHEGMRAVSVATSWGCLILLVLDGFDVIRALQILHSIALHVS